MIAQIQVSGTDIEAACDLNVGLKRLQLYLEATLFGAQAGQSWCTGFHISLDGPRWDVECIFLR